MQKCFTSDKKTDAIPIQVFTEDEVNQWLKQQKQTIQNWFAATNFRPELGVVRFIPNDNGNLERVIAIVLDKKNFWQVGQLSMSLPAGNYYFEDENSDYALAWGLGAYQFTRYKKPQKNPATLFLSKKNSEVDTICSAIYLVRDLINTPADDMGPTQLADSANQFAELHQAKFKEIVGEDLLRENYPAIYTVGRASDDAPRLIDIRWGNPENPKVTLVGKGVCFDTGGLDIKSSTYMQIMKKDMAGGAHVLGLAQMIIAENLPINLRILIPIAENSVSGNAYRPGDVIKSRKGLTIEIGNTDAEGRLVLADAITEAVSDKPELLIDIATLTGAARVAVGPDIAAVFSNNDEVVNAVIAQGDRSFDPIWRLPLYQPYREFLNSNIADINNCSSESYAGAISAALFLKEFVPDEIAWLHFDIMAWNLYAKPGKPQGGEAMAIRALFSYLQSKYQ